MTSPVDVVNIALTTIGSQSTISRIGEEGTEGSVAAILYKPKIDALHRSAHWNCMRKQLALTQLKAAIVNGAASSDPPSIPWLYEYAYPSDCLKARFILPYYNTDYTGVPFTTADSVAPSLLTGPPVKFIVATDTNAQGKVIRVILTNMPQAILVYTARIEDPDMWDPHFLNAASSTLAAWFVNALMGKRTLMLDSISVAKEIILEARVSDGNEGLENADSLPDWMRVRATRNAYYDSGYYFNGWDAMGFPGGIVV